MEKDKNKIFANASKKLNILRKKKFLQTFIFSSLLLSQAKFPIDLIAEESKNSKETITKENPSKELQIQCKDDADLELASYIRETIWKYELANKATANLFQKMENAGVIIKIIDESDRINGCYIIGQKEIRIPRNAITKAINGEISLIDTLRHEGIHFLQDEYGIFNDCKKLSPKNACIVEIMVEIDAYVKSAVMENPKIRDINSSFDCLVNLTPFFFNKALYNSKNDKILNSKEKINLYDVMSKFNMPEFDNYNDINHVINLITQNFDEEMKNKIAIAEEEYNEKFINSLTIQNDNTSKEKNNIKLKTNDTINR